MSELGIEAGNVRPVHPRAMCTSRWPTSTAPLRSSAAFLDCVRPPAPPPLLCRTDVTARHRVEYEQDTRGRRGNGILPLRCGVLLRGERKV
jgi:hypothetical protein